MVQFLNRGSDHLATDNQGLFLTTKREKGTCLWCRGKSQSLPYSRQKLAHRPQRILLVDSLNKRGRKDVPCRPVGKKTIAIRPEILPITDRTPFMGYMGISLQVGVLLGVFHHVEQRLHTDWRSTPVFHE